MQSGGLKDWKGSFSHLFLNVYVGVVCLIQRVNCHSHEVGSFNDDITSHAV